MCDSCLKVRRMLDIYCCLCVQLISRWFNNHSRTGTLTYTICVEMRVIMHTKLVQFLYTDTSALVIKGMRENNTLCLYMYTLRASTPIHYFAD